MTHIVAVTPLLSFSLLDAPDMPELGYVALTPDDDITIRLGAFVRYDWRGYDSVYGTVVAIDEAGRVEVEVEVDGDGETCWCAADRLVLILAPSAAAVGVEEK